MTALFANMPLPPASIKAILSVWRQQGWPTLTKRYPSRIDAVINEKARLAARLDAVTEFGKVAFIREGMDCDCTQYLHIDHIPRPISLVAWLKSEDERCEWLDGPESAYFGRPSDYPERHKSSDRALEAYEDGHPHSIAMTSLW